MMKLITILLLLTPMLLFGQGLHSDMSNNDFRESFPMVTTFGMQNLELILNGTSEPSKGSIQMKLKAIYLDSNTFKIDFDLEKDKTKYPFLSPNYKIFNTILKLSNNNLIETGISLNINEHPEILEICEFPIVEVITNYQYSILDTLSKDTFNLIIKTKSNEYYNTFRQTQYFTEYFRSYNYIYKGSSLSSFQDFTDDEYESLKKYKRSETIYTTFVLGDAISFKPDEDEFDQDFDPDRKDDLLFSVIIDTYLEYFYFELSINSNYHKCANIVLTLSNGSTIEIPQNTINSNNFKNNSVFDFIKYTKKDISKFENLARCKIVGIKFDEFKLKSKYISTKKGYEYQLKIIKTHDLKINNNTGDMGNGKPYDFKYNLSKVLSLIYFNK